MPPGFIAHTWGGGQRRRGRQCREEKRVCPSHAAFPSLRGPAAARRARRDASASGGVEGELRDEHIGERPECIPQESDEGKCAAGEANAGDGAAEVRGNGGGAGGELGGKTKLANAAAATPKKAYSAAAAAAASAATDLSATSVRARASMRRLANTLAHPVLWRERTKVVLLCFVAFVITNMDRVNVSVVMLPLSRYYNWRPVTVGVIQSSFFWGYLLGQIPGGLLADRYGGRAVMLLGLSVWTAMTLALPLVAGRSMALLLASRALLGLGEGVILPAMNQMVSQWIRVTERSRSLGFIYSGIYLGSMLGLSVSPSLIRNVGWPFVFWLFGGIGLLWCVLWSTLVEASPRLSRRISPQELRYIRIGMEKPQAEGSSASVLRGGGLWRRVFSSRPFWALTVSHFCVTWGYFVLLTWLPTYFNRELGFNMASSSFLAIIPWASMFALANVSGVLADAAVSRGVSTARVRRRMQTVAFLGPALSLFLLTTASSPAVCVVLLACATGLGSFCQAGVYSNHQDIGPNIAGVLLGITNTAAAIPGVVGVALTGLILDTFANSWNLVFYITIGFYILGAVVFNLYTATERQF